MAGWSQNVEKWPKNIAPMPAGNSPAISPQNMEPARPVMPYACKTCSSRKVKCDKFSPKCSSCEKSALNCEYEAPPPRKKRKVRDPNPEVHAKLAEYERILGENGLLPNSGHDTRRNDGPSPPPPQRNGSQHDVPLVRMLYNEPESTSTGKLHSGRNGESHYVNSKVWKSLGDDEALSDEEDAHSEEDGAAWEDEDPLAASFMKVRNDLLNYHPNHDDAMFLWRTHVDRVEPLCKILHIPSVNPMIKAASQQPVLVSKANECLLFAIYHFAVFSLTEEECTRHLTAPQTKTVLLRKYNFAARQSLVNASFLKTTDISVLQALTLYLISTKPTADPQTFWILTGTGIRIAQRMGLHRDGSKLKCPPFEVQMRRRLWYQLLPLDMWAGQMAGTGIAMMPETWDTEAPWNVNDSDIWPGMTEQPQERKGATEMIFCLARACLGRAFGRAKMTNGWDSSQKGVEEVIADAQEEVEETHLRYCDIVDPLHFLTICTARSGLNAMNLRYQMAKCEGGRGSEEQIREILQLTQKIVDTDSASCKHTALEKYKWYIGGLFIWGSWESLIFNLTTLRGKGGELGTLEKDEAWKRVEQLYTNHPSEMLESRRALHVAIRRLTLKAWDSCPAGRAEPQFIGTLRSLRQAALQGRLSRSMAPALSGSTPDALDTPSSAESISNEFPGGPHNDMSKHAFDLDFDLDTVDWSFWNQLIQDSQAAR